MEPLDATIQGQALESHGLVALRTVEGLGLVTNGLLWPCAGIWEPTEDPLVTTWIGVPGYSNTTEDCSGS